jgi:hypothetical protein
MSSQNKVPKVLVVDDEPDVRLLILRGFRRKSQMTNRSVSERGSNQAPMGQATRLEGMAG